MTGHTAATRSRCDRRISQLASLLSAGAYRTSERTNSERSHNLIAATLRTEKAKDPAAKVNFAFEVAAVRANNPQGRSWDFKPLMESETENPLDAFVGSVGKLQIKDGRRVLMIAAPDKTAPQVAAAKK